MIDRIFAPALTFVMLIAGTAAIISSLFMPARADVTVMAQGVTTAPAPIVLEAVVITGKRVAASQATAKATGSGHATEGHGVLLRRAHD